MATRSTTTLVNQWFDNPSKDLLSGLVVAFAMIPEAIAFSGIAGVDPKVGLFGAFCLSLTIAVVGGRMAMITSATGSTALLMTLLAWQSPVVWTLRHAALQWQSKTLMTLSL